MLRYARNVTAAGLLVVFVSFAPGVSAGKTDPRLAGRFDAGTAAALQAEVDRAAAEGVPSEPLVLKALEGAAKGATRDKIQAAIRRNAQAMREALRALGPRTSEAELTAGAGALLAGAPVDSLRSLRAARGDSSIVVPLVVMTDLLARRVPARQAADVVVASWRGGVSAAALLEMREWVYRDIQSGMDPSAALFRAREAAEREGPQHGRDGAHPVTPLRPPEGR